MAKARLRYERRFAKRSNRSRAQDLARQARVTVSASDRSKKARRLLQRWENAPNQLDVRGVDTRRRRRTRRSPMPRPPSATPPAAPTRQRRRKRLSQRVPTPRAGVTFTPAPGVPEQTTALIREYMAAVQSGKPIPSELQKRAREDEFLAEKGVKLVPPGRLRPHPIRHDPDAPPRPKPGPGDITVKFDGEPVDWLGMSAKERRKLMRSPSAVRAKRTRKAQKGTATRSVKAEAWRELRQFRPELTPEAFAQAREAMQVVMDRIEDQGEMVVTEDQRREALATVRREFGKEMKRRHSDFGPAWGRRRGTL